MIGVSFGFHDAAMAKVVGDQIVYASHAERYSRIKNDKWLHTEQAREIARFGDTGEIVYYEKPWLKNLRLKITGQSKPSVSVNAHIREVFPHASRMMTVGHHQSHAAAGYYTSPWTDAAIVVVDAIGEFDTISIWEGRGGTLRKIWSQRYPNSLGLLYSAFTQRMGLQPNRHEYIMMGMAAYGHSDSAKSMIDKDFISTSTNDMNRKVIDVYEIKGLHKYFRKQNKPILMR